VDDKQLSQLQQEREEWVEHNFPGQHMPHSLLGAVEELGELSHHYLKHTQGIRGNEDHEREMADAIADCVIYLAGVCTWLEIDFGVLVRDTWAMVKSRDWIAYPENGVDK
jgi:NTP pyrophosphatase (non-canonical NTP hydrolase)